MMAKIEVVVKAKAFSSESARNYRFCVDLSDNEIRVWDRVAGCFTNCNCLSASARRRILWWAKENAKWAR
jgi:hypothetical protein